ncbi:MAG: chemotaxis response regulator protein-glutamate methylesterase [Phycisphaerales bacterium]|nr:chemotaxis response regulator protein-glutamate methylesterase [Phycisphaerales bacterium]
MGASSIRVLIIDDSVFMRSMLKAALEKEPGVEVIGTAQNGLDGLAKIASLKPDVITLDVEMPGLTGLEVLERVMKASPLPIVMVSTKTQEGAEATLQALQLGAVDYVAKPLGEKSATLESFRGKVVHAVRTAAASNRKRLGKPPVPIKRPVAAGELSMDVVVAIGISAGGPATLHEMMPAFPKKFPPIVITQHMPADFTGPFAKRLGAVTQIEVMEATSNVELRPGMALIAPGDRHLRVARLSSRLVAQIDAGPKVSGFRPSVDVLFESVATAARDRVVGVVMTGMGHDGSVGVQILKKAGGYTIAQDEASSVVYGMPKAAAATGCIDRVAALGDIPTAITEAVRSMSAAAHANA